MNLEKHNPHWKEGFFYQFELKRELFENLVKNIDNKQIITISGMRRTGKSILMKQLINFLIKKSIKKENILYYSFDENQPKIEEIINEFQRLHESKERLYIFLDEIQKLDDWQNQIKFYYDNTTIKFIASGSSSLYIQKKVKESLAGRSFDFYLAPLNFREFLIFRNKIELIEGKKLFDNEIKKEMLLYMRRQFIETINESDEYASNYIKSILEKVIYIDIPKVFPIKQADLLLRLIRIISSNPGMIIEYESLSKEIGINRTTLSNYLFYLEETFLIKKVYNFSRNMLTTEKKSKKFYLNSTTFFTYLNPQIEESKIIENLAIIETNSKFFWRTPSKDEIDIILEKANKEIIPVEIKYKNIILDKDIKNTFKFLREFKLGKGIIVTKNLEKKESFTINNKVIKIDFIPIHNWLLTL